MLKLFLLGCLMTHIVYGAKLCPDNWVNYGNKCYWKDNTASVWDENRKNCEAMNATMVTVRSKEENDFLFKWIKNDTLYYWLSAQRVNSSASVFQWIDGSNLTYSNWNKGQPDQLSIKKALCIDINSADGEWYDFACNNKGYDIFGQMCEREINENEHHMRSYINSAINEEIREIENAIEAIRKSLRQNELTNNKRLEEINAKINSLFQNVSHLESTLERRIEKVINKYVIKSSIEKNEKTKV